MIKVDPKADSDEVVAILPFIGEKILMHLRDFNPKIRHPGYWAFFSGSVQEGERPREAAEREILEEIGYRVQDMTELGRLYISDLNDLVSHAFTCSILVPLEELHLTEGLEMALVTPEEIRSKSIYSQRLKRFLPVAPTSYIQDALNLALLARR